MSKAQFRAGWKHANASLVQSLLKPDHKAISFDYSISLRNSWVLRRSTALTAVEQETLQVLRQIHPHVELVYQLTQGFLSMLNQHQAELLDNWLTALQGCGIAGLERFGRGIEQDRLVVLAALTLPYSNGVVESHVNRLKLIKWMMYGRAGFPLLRRS